SPLLCGRMESLEWLCRSVPAHHACAQALSAAGAPERRGTLSTPGRESRLPGVFLIAGPGLRALL
ncbi:hypothetical protein STEG23_001251, partial [Scotinomys teguina]